MEIQIISLLITLLAVIIGPLVGYKIAKKNLEFKFRTMTQGKWIEKLEQTAFEFLDSNVKWVEKYDALIMRGGQKTISLKEVNKQIDDMLDSINSSLVKLDLLLDDKKSLQKQIIDDCTKMKGVAYKKSKDENDFKELRNLHKSIVTNLKEVFHRERKMIASVFKKKTLNMDKNDLLDVEEYKKLFDTQDKQVKALDKAWEIRSFEIELYWKRATYFWAFIAATFAGYIVLITSDSFNYNLKETFPQIEYIIISIGFIFSIAWCMVNIGSKKWQENWETIIDVLEDEITGPLYKTVHYTPFNFSVSKINILVSAFVTFIWIILGINYLIQNISFYCTDNTQIDWIVIFTSFFILLFIYLVYSNGLTGSGKNEYLFIQRKLNDN